MVSFFFIKLSTFFGTSFPGVTDTFITSQATVYIDIAHLHYPMPISSLFASKFATFFISCHLITMPPFCLLIINIFDLFP